MDGVVFSNERASNLTIALSQDSITSQVNDTQSLRHILAQDVVECEKATQLSSDKSTKHF